MVPRKGSEYSRGHASLYWVAFPSIYIPFNFGELSWSSLSNIMSCLFINILKPFL